MVNALLVHDYGHNSLRRVKTDRKDSIKLANYGLAHWLTLPRYAPEEKNRLLLRNCFRQYQQYAKVQTILKNNLIALLDNIFPFSEDKVAEIYNFACRQVSPLPKNDTSKLLVEQAVSQLRAAASALAALRKKMKTLAATINA